MNPYTCLVSEERVETRDSPSIWSMLPIQDENQFFTVSPTSAGKGLMKSFDSSIYEFKKFLLYVCIYVSSDVCMSAPRFIQFVLGRCYAPERIVKMMKVYIERNNMQVELIRFHKNIDFIHVYFCEATNFTIDAMCDVYALLIETIQLYFKRTLCIRFHMFAFLITRLTYLS